MTYIINPALPGLRGDVPDPSGFAMSGWVVDPNQNPPAVEQEVDESGDEQAPEVAAQTAADDAQAQDEATSTSG